MEKDYTANFDVGLISDATERILKLIIECAEEPDVDKQLNRAKAIEILTTALARIDFKIDASA